jgi:thiol-disulfide isomerase/thioredoxin
MNVWLLVHRVIRKDARTWETVNGPSIGVDRGPHLTRGPRLTLQLIANGALVACGLFWTACDSPEKPASVTRERSQAVQATAPAAAPEREARVEAPEPPKPRRKLCEGQIDKPGRVLSKSALSRARGPGAPDLPETLRVQGKWTWLNFWAAWCVPCKEEIPRLKEWEKKLSAAGKPFQLTFVSLDDDARQLNKFLESQPDTGLRTTYWLREGKERSDWFSTLELDPDPQLPAHLLVDPKGRVRCFVSGAVEDSDYPELTSLLGN